MRAIIYTRVSTTEQADTGYSLDSQELACRRFAQTEGTEVKKVFVERGESAKTIDRPELKAALKYTSENKIDFFIVWKLDRLARNLMDQLDIIRMFSQQGVRLLSVMENNEESPTGRLMRNIIGSFAQFDNEQRAQVILTHMKSAVKHGRYVFHPPIGYSYIIGEDKHKILSPNQDAYLIKEAFKKVSENVLNQREIREYIEKKYNRVIAKQTLNRVLRNVLYIGKIRVKWFDEIIDGIHQPIIEPSLFYKVQQILNSRHIRTEKTNNTNHPDFPLKKSLICPVCGKQMRGYYATGRSGKKYGYYRCSDHINVAATKVHESFVELLKSYELKPVLQKLYREIIIELWVNDNKDRGARELELKKELDKLIEQKERATSLLLEGVLDKDIYKKKRSELDIEVSLKRVEYHETRIDKTEIDILIDFSTLFIANLSELWLKSDYERKVQLQNIVFTSKLVLNKDLQFANPVTGLIFNHLTTSVGDVGAYGGGGGNRTRVQR